MAFDWLTSEHIAGEWRVITQAPLFMLASIGAAVTGGYFAARFRYSIKIEHIEARMSLKDDQLADYKNKLSGATPDEAKARLDALEAKISAMGPRRLTDDQKNTITKILASHPGLLAHVSQDMAANDARAYVADFLSAFNNAGWKTVNPMVMGLGNPPQCGIGLAVVDPASLTDAQKLVVHALEEAGVQFELQKRSPAPVHMSADAEILVTSSFA